MADWPTSAMIDLGNKMPRRSSRRGSPSSINISTGIHSVESKQEKIIVKDREAIVSTAAEVRGFLDQVGNPANAMEKWIEATFWKNGKHIRAKPLADVAIKPDDEHRWATVEQPWVVVYADTTKQIELHWNRAAGKLRSRRPHKKVPRGNGSMKGIDGNL